MALCFWSFLQFRISLSSTSAFVLSVSFFFSRPFLFLTTFALDVSTPSSADALNVFSLSLSSSVWSVVFPFAHRADPPFFFPPGKPQRHVVQRCTACGDLRRFQAQRAHLACTQRVEPIVLPVVPAPAAEGDEHHELHAPSATSAVSEEATSATTASASASVALPSSATAAKPTPTQ